MGEGGLTNLQMYERQSRGQGRMINKYLAIQFNTKLHFGDWNIYFFSHYSMVPA